MTQDIDAVRRFNRFYTRRIGVLQEGYLTSPFSLTEARVIYELAQRETATASVLGKELDLDAGYLSRLLKDFERRGLISRKPSPSDARQSLIALTAAGREAFAELDAGSRRQIGAMLDALAPEDRETVVRAMGTVERLLGTAPPAPVAYVLRPHRPGDMGWVVHRHGVLYSREYGWDERFEALVAEIVAKFVKDYDPRRERCWIAEIDGEPMGSVFLVDAGDGVAKLRCLLVEPKARGLGVGKRLVEECVRFARQVGYAKITLWTNDVLQAARGIYEQAGFRLVAAEPHQSFGQDLVGETWELEL